MKNSSRDSVFVRVFRRSRGSTPNSEWSTWLTEHCDDTQAYTNGRLRIPPNLYIYATMNTSDQSLYPMDTAFRRRWGMQYMGIGQGNSNNVRVPLHSADPTGVSWPKLLRAINTRIVQHTRTDDKQMGPWFIRGNGHDTSVSQVEFKSKVLFYLWNDVFRDQPEQIFVADVRTFEDLQSRYANGHHVFTPEVRSEAGFTEPGE